MNLRHFNDVIGEKVMEVSLLRSLTVEIVRNQLRRMVIGYGELTAYSFSYILPSVVFHVTEPIELSFQVSPGSMPPTNIHAIIGRNGTGKTNLLNNIARSILKDGRESHSQVGKLVFHHEKGLKEKFANVLHVSFSSFDIIDYQIETPFLPPVRFIPIGIQKYVKPASYITKSVAELTDEFIHNLSDCRSSALHKRWLDSIKTLESDPNFQQANLAELIETIATGNHQEIRSTFLQLSSGHKIVLLTITMLIANLFDKSLVLIDEPEIHLHPPLLSAFIRTVSDLLTNTNGVAIIATHSPIVLQEVPRNCVWHIRRNGPWMTAERLEIETFGENMGVLSNNIFGLEVTKSGFYSLLEQAAIDNNYDYVAALASFDGQLGMEAKGILMSIIAIHNNSN